MSFSVWRASNSAGLGGVGPARSRSRLGLTPEAMICELMSSMVTLSLVSRGVIPRSRSLMLKSRPRAGLRMSRPQRTTFLPSSANDTPRLAALNVLPSPDVDDVKRMTFWSPVIMNWMFVRIERNISSIWLFLFSCTTMPADVFTLSLATATSATMGRSVRRSTSSCPSIL